MQQQRKCMGCGAELTIRYKIKYCSNKCQMNYQYLKWVEMWKNGRTNGNVGIRSRNISTHLRRYLIDKYGNRCSVCNWSRKHSITGVVPLEIDHIDGNSENNLEENLRLICPNCHALTPYYKNLNRGKGRKWRTDKYIKNSEISKFPVQS